jgi:multiple RNA-binding domain-containing protein 1
MDSSRLVVEFAYKYGSTDGPRAWSKYTPGTSAHIKKVATGANDVPVVLKVRELKKLKKQQQQQQQKEAEEKKKGGGGGRPEDNDPKLQEFLQVMQPRNKQTMWANDDPAGLLQQGTTTGDDVVVDSDDDDEYEELPTNNDNNSGSSSDDDDDEEDDGDKEKVVVDDKVSDLDYLKSRMKKNFDDINDNKEEEEEEEDEEEDEEDESEEEDDRAGSPPEEEVVVVEQQQQQQQDHTNNNNIAATRQQSSIKEANGDKLSIIADTGRLFLRNLSYAATESDIRELLEPHGQLNEVHLVIDNGTKKSKGFALATFTDPSDALSAFQSLDASIFMGRLLHILPGQRPPPPLTDDDNGDGTAENGGGYKAQRAKQLKSTAGTNKAAWNSLFMRSDTVAEAVAAHFGVNKSALLDREAADVAVRLALGETHVIAETKRALGEAGVVVQILEEAAAEAGTGSGSGGKVVRSDVAMLVKNLPYSSNEEELLSMFETNGGPVARFILPPTHTLAVVEFEEPGDARKAFKSLAYKRYQHVPLYLEWAPRGIFSGSGSGTTAVQKTKKKGGGEKEIIDVDVAGTTTTNKKREEEDEEEEVVINPNADAALLPTTDHREDDGGTDSHTIFVKGLSFATEEATLTKHFEKAVKAAGGTLRSVKIARKKAPTPASSKKGKKKDDDNSAAAPKMLSAGYGFVECSSDDVARAVVAVLNGKALEGHQLSLQISSGGGGGGGTASDKNKKSSSSKMDKLPVTTKMVVRNVAFEATKKDIMGLFTPFGHIKSCRLPRKFDGTPRGFAFVDFATKQEAKNAMDAVQGAHLYGRRLVLEWAEDEEGLDELRAKTAAKYRAEDYGDGDEEEEGEGRRKKKMKM